MPNTPRLNLLDAKNPSIRTLHLTWIAFFLTFVDHAAYIDRFVMEEWVGRRLSNRHLIKMLKKQSEPRFLFHVIEYVEGRSLRDWIRCNAQASVSEVVGMVEQMITMLRAMHPERDAPRRSKTGQFDDRG